MSKSFLYNSSYTIHPPIIDFSLLASYKVSSQVKSKVVPLHAILSVQKGQELI